MMEKERASISCKREFIRWILKNKKMKRRESVWFLNYLLGNEEKLKSISFVENAHFCPIAVVMSTSDADYIPFRFFKGLLMTADAEKAFHEMRLHEDGLFYIQINFGGKEVSELYQQVLEENTCAPNYEEVKEKKTTKRAKETEAIMSDVMNSAVDAYYDPRIDAALDSRDEEEFLRLTQEKMMIKGD